MSSAVSVDSFLEERECLTAQPIYCEFCLCFLACLAFDN